MYVAIQPTQMVPAIALSAIITATDRRPATAVSRVAETSGSIDFPSARRRRAMSGRRNATALHARPHPAIGSPVILWTAEANAPFQTAAQSNLPPNPQKELPPERTRTSSSQRTTDHRAESAPRKISFARLLGVATDNVGVLPAASDSATWRLSRASATRRSRFPMGPSLTRSERFRLAEPI